MLPRAIDLTVVASANTFNLLMVALFVARAGGQQRTEATLGMAVVAIAVPLGFCVAWNAWHGRPLWTRMLPTPLIAFCAAEALLDYALRIPFRSTWALWPYLALYFAGVLALIGYSFAVGKACGFATLSTYFLALGAAWYAHAGGHSGH